MFIQTRVFFIGALLAGSLFFVGCKSSMSLVSNSLDREIVVDGSEEEWVDVLTPIEDKNFAIGVINDDEYLYVSLVTATPEVRNQILMSGMTLWLDPEGGKDKQVGIRFPLGLMETGMPPGGPMAMQREPELMEQFFNESLNEFEHISKSKGQTVRWIRSEVEDIEIDAASNTGTFTYELKMPLSSELLGYALDVTPGQAIGVGLETPEIDREALREQMQERGGMGDGMGNRGGFGDRGGIGAGMGGGGMAGRNPMMRQRNMPEALDFWATYTLASN